MKNFTKKIILPLFLIVAFLMGLCACTNSAVQITLDTQMEGVYAPIIKVTPDTDTLKLPVLEAEGYEFLGWYTDITLLTPVDITVIPTDDTTFYAKWSRNLITVTFDSDPVVTLRVPYGSSLRVADMPSVLPEIEGKDGYWLTGDLTNITKPITIKKDYRLKSRAITYLVDYPIPDSDGTTYPGYYVYSRTEGAIGQTVTPPSAPEREGYDFLNWYYDTALTDVCDRLPLAIGDNNVILYGSFIDTEDMAKYISCIREGDAMRVVGLTSLGKTQSSIVIPDFINGYPVKYIGYNEDRPYSQLGVFGSTALKTVTLPTQLVSIGDFAFADCKKLEVVNTRKATNLNRVGKGAFAGCVALRSINLNGKVNSIGSYAFGGITTIPTPNALTLTTVEKWYTSANWYLTDMSLTSITLADSSPLTDLQDRFLYNCSTVTEFRIPQGLTQISYKTFYGSSINLLTVASSNQVLRADSNGGIYTNISTLIYYPVKGIDNPIFDKTLKIISADAFRENDSVTTLSLPDSLIEIQTSAFEGAVRLSALSLENATSLTTIGDRAFYDCDALTNVRFNYGLTEIGAYSFADCSNLYKVDFGISSLASIPRYAFTNCAKLNNLVLPATVTTISENAFSYCAGLNTLDFDYLHSNLSTIADYAFFECVDIHSVTLPNSVTSIGNYAFASKTSFMKINTRLPLSLQRLGDYAFLNCDEMIDATLPNSVVSLGVGSFKNNRLLVNISLPTTSTVTVIPQEFFYGCTSLQDISLPANIMEIGDMAFFDCSALTSITFMSNGNKGLKIIGVSAFENCASLTSNGGSKSILPSTLTTLKARAFYNCSALNSVSIPVGLKVISAEAFYNCAKLNLINYYDKNATVLTTIGENAFANCVGLTTVSLPSSLGLREADNGFIGNPFSGCAGLLSFTFATEHSDLFSTDGVVYQRLKADINSAPTYGIYAYPTGKTASYVVANNISAVSPYAFFGSNINELSFEVGVTTEGKKNILMVSLGEYAFANCKLLSTVTLSDRVYRVDDCAFRNSKIVNLTIDASSGEYVILNDNPALTDNLISLGDYSFAKTAVNKLNIPSRVTVIGDYAFANSHSLGELTFTNSSELTLTIGTGAFMSCNLLTQVTLPYQLTTVGDYAFSYCVSLTTVDFNYLASLEINLSLGAYAFSDCHYLYRIKLPDSIGSLGEGVLSSNTRLTYVDLPVSLGGKTLALPDNAFYSSPALLEFTLPDYVVSIGAHCFERTNVARVNVGQNSQLRDIGAYAFNAITTLNSFTFPSSIATVGEYAFASSNLGALTIYSINALTLSPYAFYKSAISSAVISGLKFIPDYCFADTSSLRTVCLTDSGISVGKYAFCNSALTSIDGARLNSVDDYAFANCKTLNFLIGYLSLSYIGEKAFYNCGSLSEDIEVTAQNLTVKSYAFEKTNIKTISFNATNLDVGAFGLGSVPNLTSVSLTSDVLSLVDGFCYGSDNLSNISLNGGQTAFSAEDGVIYRNNIDSTRSVTQYPANRYGASFTMPSDVKGIGDYAFGNARYISSVIITSDLILTKEANSFIGLMDRLILFVPSDSINAYITAWRINNVEATIVELEGLSLKHLSGDNYSIYQYIGYTPDLVIKPTYTVNGNVYNITEIDSYAFYSKKTLINLTLPDSIQKIGKYAFGNTVNLQSVDFGLNLLSIDDYAFYNSNLSSALFKNQLAYVGGYAFYGCVNLDNVYLPDSLRKIEDFAFANCSRLENLTFGEELMQIGNFAFANCDSLQAVTLPNKLLLLGDYIFGDSENLTYIMMDTNKVPALTSDKTFDKTASGLRIFVKGEMLSKYLTTAEWKKYAECILPIESIIEGTSYAVELINGNNYRLIGLLSTDSTVIINSDLGNGKTLVAIGAKAVNQFVTDLTIGDGVLTIDENAFVSAINLVNVSISDSVVSIGNSAFRGLRRLGEVNFGATSNLESIGAYAFYDSSLTVIHLPSKLKYIGDYSFSGSDTMGIHTVTTSNAPTYTIDYIGYYAFSKNPKLQEIAFSCYIKVIKDFAFAECVGLQRFALVRDANIRPTNYTDIGSAKNIFKNVNNLSIVVPSNLEIAYRANWSIYSTRLTVLGNYVNGFAVKLTSDASADTAYIVNYVGADTVVDIPASVIIDNKVYRIIKIGEYAFSGAVTSVNIPSSVTEISNHAFDGATSLTNVTFSPNSKLTVIGQQAFANCINLRGIIIPNSIAKIDIGAFAGCSMLTNVVFADRPAVNVYLDTTISSYAFYRCVALESINLPKYIKRIDKYAFAESTKLRTVNFATDSIIDIVGDYCFQKTAISDITLPRSLHSIGDYSFDGCKQLSSVRITRSSIDGGGVLTGTKPNIFNNTDNCFIKVYVPLIDYDAYKNPTAGWHVNDVVSALNSASSHVSTVIPDQSAEGFNYIITSDSHDNKTVTLTNYCLDNTSVFIPSTVFIVNDTYKITAIGRFFANKTVKTVTFANTSFVTKIEAYAFAKASSLIETKLSDSVRDIKEYAFAYCSALKRITLPVNDGYKEIDRGAFTHCSSLREITLPAQIEDIKEDAFANSENLCRVIVNFPLAKAYGNGAFNNTHSKMVIIVEDDKKTHFAKEWLALSDRIYAKSELYGDFILSESADGYTLIQYTGTADELNLNTIIIKDKYIIAVKDGAILNKNTKVISTPR